MYCDDTEWLTERVERTKTLIVAYEDAILALSTGSQSYTLDTGQTRQTVTKAMLADLRSTLNSLENRMSTLQARLGGARTHVIPGF
jgi:hypothetical protein